MHVISVRTATPTDLDGARAVMLDTVYREFGTGYLPGWHGDIVDPGGAYLLPARHTLLVAVDEAGETVGTGALDARGPGSPPNPGWLAQRYPSGPTAQLRRVYVRPECRRRGIARELVRQLVEFAVADGGYRALYLHTDPAVPGAEAFWRSLGKVVHDERTDPEHPHSLVHFELPMGR
ncbi:GNAT family N-acetyltransferase [Streptomyces sp. NPDC052101]|uniref:GNAT family N-acetyltransferase n=1 Tax=Streptomyces sp. NPDC052101 TaxID=3155763 RepID=UPI00341F05D5